MKDRDVEFPRRYLDQNDNYWTLTPAPGAVTEEGSFYNKANVLPDAVCASLRLPAEAAEPRDAFLRAATGYRTAAAYGKNIAYLLSQFEIMGKVQDHSHMFYDVFYPNHTPKVGYIDNRKISVAGNLAAGTQTIPATSLDVSQYPVTDRYANGNWQEFTIEDQASSEIVYAKDTPVFASVTYDGVWPATATIQEAGVYRVTLMGGKGAEIGSTLTTVDGGGKGGTLIFDAEFKAGDVLTLEKVEGSGMGMRLLKNGVLIAVAGGGGRAGGQLVISTDPMQKSQQPGGDGGSDTGGDGWDYTYSGSKGAIGAQGGSGYSGYPDSFGLNAPDGRGGKEYCTYQGGAPAYGARIGGGGYAGGGGNKSQYLNNLWTLTAGGGASSFLAEGYTAIENSRGTNAGDEYALISKKDMMLKEPLKNSYTNPTLYRSKLTIDTVNHKAVLPAGAQQLRILVRDIAEFYDFAVWLQGTGLTCSEARASYEVNAEVGEDVYQSCLVTEHAVNTKEIHVDGSGIMSKGGRYLALRLDVQAAADAEIQALYGALA